jgi:hypothetical protein
MLKTKSKLTLRVKEIKNKSEIQNFLWNFGVGVATEAFRFDLLELNMLLNRGIVIFADCFVLKFKILKEEDDLEKVEDYRLDVDEQFKMQKILQIQGKINFQNP